MTDYSFDQTYHFQDYNFFNAENGHSISIFYRPAKLIDLRRIQTIEPIPKNSQDRAYTACNNIAYNHFFFNNQIFRRKRQNKNSSIDTKDHEIIFIYALIFSYNHSEVINAKCLRKKSKRNMVHYQSSRTESQKQHFQVVHILHNTYIIYLCNFLSKSRNSELSHAKQKQEKEMNQITPLCQFLQKESTSIELIINFTDCQYMLAIQKKKRSNSGSRSKSKKYKNGEFSVDIRSRQPTEGIKILTENSSSLNKSKPSRKTSIKQSKKHNKSSNKDPRDQASHSVSADRKHSLTKMNKTEVNYEGDDVDKQISQVMMRLKHLKLPPCTNIQLIKEYFQELRQCFQGMEDNLFHFCIDLHSYYMAPLKPLFQIMEPYENHLKQREEIGKQIDEQVTLSQKLWTEMTPVDIQIFKARQHIEENRRKIEKLKEQKLQKIQTALEKPNEPKSFPSHQKTIQMKQSIRPQKIQHIGKGFKLDLQHITKEGQVGFHEQFYSKLDEFSQSWRDQALRQKRF